MSVNICIICGRFLLEEDKSEEIRSGVLKERSDTLHAQEHDRVTNNIIIKMRSTFTGREGDSKPKAMLPLRNDAPEPPEAKDDEINYSCCEECKARIEDGCMPIDVVKDGRVCGGIPEPLLILNDEEWNLLLSIETTKSIGKQACNARSDRNKHQEKSGITMMPNSSEPGALSSIEQMICFLKGSMVHERKKYRHEVRLDVVMNAVKWLKKKYPLAKC